MTPPYPPIEPYERGWLDVGDGNHVYWETCGNRDGKPAVMVHGGPGSGCSTNMRRAFDPARYRAVLFDQRGSGRSRPHASDPATDLAVNTTEHLIADMERLREHLRIEQWLLYGGSWGSTLLLAYAQRYPERVTEIVITSVTMTRRSEIDWLYRGVGRFFPEAWERFSAVAPGAATPELLAEYGRLMAHPESEVRYQAANAWMSWEDAVVSAEPNGRPNTFTDRPADSALAFARICAHYFSNGAFLPEGALLDGAGRLARIPGVLVHGRLDMSGPAHTAWELARAWPAARLHVIEDSGHTGSDAMRLRSRAALDEFAGRPA